MNNWKKALTVSILAIALAFPGAALADTSGMKEMTIKVDYSKVQVMIQDGMELVPLRKVAESLGYEVMWNESDMSIKLTYSGMTDGNMMKDGMMKDDKMKDEMMMNKDMPYIVTVHIGKNTAMVNRMDNMIDNAPILMNDRTYVTKSFIEMYLATPMMPMMK